MNITEEEYQQALSEARKQGERDAAKKLKPIVNMFFRATVLTDDEGLEYREIDEGQLQSLQSKLKSLER